MISTFEAIILGIIQGLTEWIPVSSSGHLALAQIYLGLPVPVAFDVMLHFATLLVIFVVFWNDILKMLKSVFSFDFKSKHGKLALYIIIASIPTAIIGFSFHDLFESFFYNERVIAVSLLFTGILLFFSDKKLGNKKLNGKNSFLIGVAQGLAIIPGISRSGITISLGLMRGIEKKTIAKFSFLMSVPAIFGAAIFEGKDLVFSGIDLFTLSVAMITSFIVGYASLKYLMKLIIRKKFHIFSYYCLILGSLVLILSIFK